MYQANQELGPAFISVDLRHSRATVCVVSGRGWAVWEGVVGVMVHVSVGSKVECGV